MKKRKESYNHYKRDEIDIHYIKTTATRADGSQLFDGAEDAQEK